VNEAKNMHLIERISCALPPVPLGRAIAAGRMRGRTASSSALSIRPAYSLCVGRVSLSAVHILACQIGRTCVRPRPLAYHPAVNRVHIDATHCSACILGTSVCYPWTIICLHCCTIPPAARPAHNAHGGFDATMSTECIC
jgi:hypothetical protein